jgi:beta-N-acetylhexosaminidase
VIDLPPPGASVLDRPIAVVRRGPADAERRVLVVGAIHGDEPGGRQVTRALLRRRPPAGVAFYVVHDLNPDGSRRGTRQNARRVDLNRNLPHRWRPAPRGRYWPGPAAGSEPETRFAMRLTRAIRPHVSVWLHQPYGFVVPAAGSSTRLVRRYARAARMPVRRLPRYRGTAAGWQNSVLRNGGAFVVELPAGRLRETAVRRHVRAIATVARSPAPATTAAADGAVTTAGRTGQDARPRRPAIAWTPIPFGPERRAQMRRYARRHAGIDTAELRDPKVIVQHFTASSTFRSAFETFRSNAPNLGEKPGVCAHFLIDADGTIHQLVPLRRQCRHTVGLNHTAIGIEHVGTSDAQVMGNRRQLAASLRLTRWLRARYGIAVRDVIGHAESLSSPHHRERVASWRRLTHGDFATRTMRRYRARLR